MLNVCIIFSTNIIIGSMGLPQKPVSFKKDTLPYNGQKKKVYSQRKTLMNDVTHRWKLKEPKS